MSVRAVKFKPQINAQLVEMLEVMLDAAKTGELIEVMYVGKCKDGSWRRQSSTTDNAMEAASVMMAEALSRLGFRASS